jgi:Holliday junction resolvase
VPTSSRRKGLTGEREVARIWQRAGFDVRNLEGRGDHIVICGNGVMIHSEVKRAERLKMPQWVRQVEAEAPPGTVPLLQWRQTGGVWRADLPLSELVTLLGVYT